MASYNRVLVMGNLTRDVDLKYTPTGTVVAEIGLAMNETFKNKAGEKVEQVCFVDVIVWGRQAETAAEYLAKGSPVFVEGRLQLDQWEDEKGGKRSKLRIRADRVQFLGSGKKGAPIPDESRAPDGAVEYEDDIPY